MNEVYMVLLKDDVSPALLSHGEAVRDLSLSFKCFTYSHSQSRIGKNVTIFLLQGRTDAVTPQVTSMMSQHL